MTIRALRNLLYSANFVGLLTAIVLAVSAISSATVVQPVYRPIQAGAAGHQRASSDRQRPAGDYKSCMVAGILEPVKPIIKKKKEKEKDNLPLLKGHYKLYSTFFVSSPGGKKQGYAAIAYENNEGMYTEKESVGEYVLAQIFPDKVILEKGGTSFTLERESSAGRSAPASSSRSTKASKSRPKRTRSRSAPQHEGPKDRSGRSAKDKAELRSVEERNSKSRRGERESPGSNNEKNPSSQDFVISNKDRNYITDNFGQILHDVNLRTELTEEGSMTGVKIERIKTGSILYTKGNLRAGDIIRSINGTPVNSVRQVVSLYGDLTKQEVTSVSVEIERNGRLITQNYSITD